MKKDLIKFLALILIFAGSIMLLMKKDFFIQPKVVAFLGDSITQFGWEEPNGYVKQVVTGLSASGIKIIPVPAGICGHTSLDMLNRIDKDVLSKKPDIMFFMGGLNDIWLNKGTFDEYKNNIKQIVDKAQQAGAKVVLMNLTLISEEVNSDMNKEIDRYNEFLKTFAEEKHLLYIDLNGELKAELRKYDKGQKNILTVDGVHLNDKGNTIVAQKIIKEYLKNLI